MMEPDIHTKILLADDEVLISEDLEMRLGNLGYAICGKVTTGEEAVRRAETDRPDLILMDIVLGGEIDGITAAETIRNKWDIPVVFITAYADTDRLERAKLAYPFGYILKPFRDRELNITVEMALYVARAGAEKRKAEIVLRETEERLRLSLESARAGVWIWDLQTDHVYWDSRMQELFGLEPGAFDGTFEGWKNLIHPDDIENAVVLLKQYAKHGGRFEYEYRAIGPDNRQRNLSSSAVVISDEEGRLLRMAGMAVDITERKRAEQALKEEAIRRRILVEQSRDGIVIIDPNGKVYESNLRFAEMLGYPLAEVLDLYVWDWDTQWSREQLLGMIAEVDETGDHFETQHRRKDGTFLDVEISTNGAICGGRKLIFCVCRDITVRKQVEKEQKEQESLYRNIFSAIDDAVGLHELVYENGRAVDYRVIDINPGYESITGLTREFALGKTGAELGSPERDEILSLYAKALETGRKDWLESEYISMGKHMTISVFPTGNHKFATIIKEVALPGNQTAATVDHP